MEIKKLVRKNIHELKPYTSARSSHLNGVLLDANENSLGSVIDDFGSMELNRYPDPSQNSMRAKLSEYLKVKKENLFFGVGSDEIIDLLIRIFCEPGKDKAMILQPTYGMYKVACDINNVETLNVDLTDKFQIDVEAVHKNYRPEVKLIFLCTPNNPTGNLIRKDDIIRLSEKYDSIIVVDEAYIDFSINDSLINTISERNNIVIVRTFSKAWGLAGIRCGYCIADPFIVSLLMNVKAPYSINKFVFYSVDKALEKVAVKDKFVAEIKSERIRVKKELISINGIENVFHSDANFLLFKCRNSNIVLKKMAEKGIIIRERSGHKYLGNCLRVTIGTRIENDMFLNLLRELI